MKLHINEETIEAPNESTIRQKLETLQTDDFAILSKGEYSYIQTMLDEEGIVLEYQDGTLENHFATKESPSNIGDVATAFVQYLNESDEWRTQFEWKQIELSPADYCVVALVSSVNEIENPFDENDRVELPNIGIDDLLDLYALLNDESPEQLDSEFMIHAQTETAEWGEIQLVPMPIGLLMALADLKPDQIVPVAEGWQKVSDIEPEAFAQAEINSLVDGLAAMATSALKSSRTLVICVLDVVV